MTPGTPGLAEEVIAPDEAGRDRRLRRVSQSGQYAPPPVRADPPVQPGTGHRLRGSRVHRAGRSAGRTPRRPLRGAGSDPGVHQVRERLVRERPGKGPVRGMSITIAGVPGENLTPGATSQDFVLNSHPVMVAAQYQRSSWPCLKRTRPAACGGILELRSHPGLARIRVGRPPAAVLSTSTSRTGAPRLTCSAPVVAVRYIVRPRSRSHPARCRRR